MRREVPVAVLLTSLLAGRLPAAQTVAPWNAAPDVVVLTDRARLEGRVVDLRLGESLTLRTADGALHVVRWTEIDHATGPAFDAGLTGSPAAPPPPSSAARGTPTLAASYLQARPGSVPVRVTSDGAPLTLSAIVALRDAPPSYTPLGDPDEPFPASVPTLGGSGSYGPYPPHPTEPGVPSVHTRVLCATPCTLHLVPGRTALHVGGAGRVESVQTLMVRDAPVSVTFRSSSATLYGAGLVLTLFGTALSIAGVAALVIEETHSGAAAGGQSLYPLAIGGIAAGMLGLAIGVPLVVRSRTGIARIGPLERDVSVTPAIASLSAQWVGGAPSAVLRVTF